MSDFLSIEEVGNLLGSIRNPPKPISKQAINKNLKAGKYALTRQVKSENGGGKDGLKYEIHISSLTKEAQAKHKANQVQQAVTTLNEQAASDEIPAADAAQKDHAEQEKQRQKRKEQGLSEFAKLPKAKKDHAKAKERLLMALYGYMRVHGDKKRPAIKGFCESVNQGIGATTRDCPYQNENEAIELHPVIQAVIPTRFGVQQLGESTLKQWLYAYESDGIIALVSKSSNAGRQCVIAENEGLKRYVIGFMVKFPLASASKIKAALAAQKPELDLVHERSIDRYMNQWKTDNAQLWTYVTHPDKWKSVYMPAYGSHFEGIERLNQLWEMDSTPWDAILVDGRHSVLAVIDLFSRRMVFHVSKTSSCLHFSRWR